MTANKDFKRIVRARAARTGESYAQALQRLRAQDAAPGVAGEEPSVKITRAFPDIRSDDIEASRSFYSGLLGFDVSMELDKFLLFTSPSDPNIQVSLNGDFDSLPAGFIVDVGTGDRVREIHDSAVEQACASSSRSTTSPGGSAGSRCSTRADRESPCSPTSSPASECR